jgi:hypothetical protein
MATVAYPSELPYPLLTGLARRNSETGINQSGSDGPPDYVKWTDSDSNQWQVTWRFTPAQKRTFDAWYYTTLNNGSLWFDIELPIAVDSKGQNRAHEASLSGMSPPGSHQGAFIIVSAVLTVRNVYRDERSVTNSLLGLISTGDDPNEIVSLLEKLVNVDLGGIA